jgi:hypothetical protein
MKLVRSFWNFNAMSVAQNKVPNKEVFFVYGGIYFKTNIDDFFLYIPYTIFFM